MTKTKTKRRGKSSTAKLILSILADCGGEADLNQIARHDVFTGIRYKRIQDGANRLVIRGEVTHFVDGRGDVYTIPETPEPEDKFTAPKVDKTKPVRRKRPTKKSTRIELDPHFPQAPKKSRTELELAFPKTLPKAKIILSPLSPKVKGAKYTTREDWLLAAVAIVRPLFDEIGADAYPPFRVSCGWPKGGRKAIGQCWPSTRSGDETIEMFLSPEISDPFQVVHITIHELIHAIDNCVNGHKGPFRKLAKAIGLEGKMTATVPGDALGDKIRLLLGNLGPYPHATLDASRIKKQSTRMLKVVCTDAACGYTLRTTTKWIELGLPTCFCGNKMEAK